MGYGFVPRSDVSTWTVDLCSSDKYAHSMYSVRVEADFSAAHQLIHYHGKCERLHGHNYHLRLWAKGDCLGEGGMLIDFGILKKALRTVAASLDHRNLNEVTDFMDDPSAERIAKYVFDRVCDEFRTMDADPTPLFAVDVYETPVNMARYERS